VTIVDNVDGDYIANDPADHCKHGVYVGGCGYDFMCGACENGDPDMTLREAIAAVDREARKVWALHDRLAAAFVDDPAVVKFDLDAWLTNGPYAGRLERACRQRDWIATVCDGLDDNNYLARLHAEAIDTYRKERS
jgi:hypothetical protein